MKRELGLTLMAISLMAIGCSTASERSRIMSWERYAGLRHVVPYVIDVSLESGGRLVYIGSHHVYDPNHLDVKVIETLWDQVDPDIAFNEGGEPPTVDDPIEAIELFGEAGFVRHLAGRDSVPVRSLDPTRRDEVAALIRSFDCESLRLFYSLRQVNHHNRHPVEPLEELMGRVFATLDAIPELRCGPGSLDALESAYRRRFPERGNLDTVSPDWFDPVRSDTWLNEVSRASSDMRDAFIVDRLTRETLAGKRVFAVAGASHVVMQEKAIRSILRE